MASAFTNPDVTVPGNSRTSLLVSGERQNHQVTAYANPDALNRKFQLATYSGGKDVLALPPEMHIAHARQPGAEARRVYRSLERDLIAELHTGTVRGR